MKRGRKWLLAGAISVAVPVAAAQFIYKIPPASCTTTLADAEESTVSTAITNATSVDTICLPTDTADWTTQLAISKCLTIKGNGIGNTIIRDASATDNLISWTIPAACTTARWTGIEFQKNGGADKNHGVLTITGDSSTSRQARVDHNKWGAFSGGFSLIGSDWIGVADHNEFVDSLDAIFMEITNVNWGGVGFSNKSWSDAPNYGDSRALFLEDNIFTHTGGLKAVTDGYLGARYVARYNTITNGWFEAHGSDSTPGGRGTRLMDIYYNKYICTVGAPCNYAANFRSGTAVIHDNTFYQYSATPIATAAYRLAQSFGPWGPADGYGFGDLNDAGSPFETNTATGGSTGTLIRTGAGWSAAGNGQWAGYSVRKTTCTAREYNQCNSIIVSNTTDTLTYEVTSYPVVALSFANGDAYTIDRVTNVIDQPGRGAGSQLNFQSFISTNSCTASGTTGTCNTVTAHGLATNDKVAIGGVEVEGRWNRTFNVTGTPTTTSFTVTNEASGLTSGNYGGVMKLPATNDQVNEPIYEWNNCVDTQNPPRYGCGGGGTNAQVGTLHPTQIISGTHYINDTARPAYTDYTYPHPLVH